MLSVNSSLRVLTGLRQSRILLYGYDTLLVVLSNLSLLVRESGFRGDHRLCESHVYDLSTGRQFLD